MRGRGVHQVLAGAAPRDAITNHALLARDLFRARGWRAEIFCDDRHLSPDLQGAVHPHGRWASITRPEDMAILHYSIDSPAFSLVQEYALTTAVHYHNITPPALLWRDAPALAAQCAEGRSELPSVIARTQIAAADSDFNGDELRGLGMSDVTTVGVLRSTPKPTNQSAATSPGSDAPLNILFVGRIVPNKCQHDLILALGALQQAGTDARLDLVGSAGGNRAYFERCRRLAQRAGVADAITFHGSIDDAALEAAYGEADVFLCLSEHEGYCVPLLEAMDHGLPIVAYAAGAVPETLGRAGLLLDEKSPSTVAEAVIEVVRNPALSAEMMDARRVQLAFHSPDQVAQRLMGFVERLASC